MTDTATHIPEYKSDKLGWGVISAYGTPTVGIGYMYLLINLYIMKFSTDVLLIAPAVMGTIFGISRVWDAISDPLVGYLSDKT
ncbi:MAG: MFS transporter, partial [Proteobacteria bacterium]|nr:MFS transporter [Pseudomonadota bacterium]